MAAITYGAHAPAATAAKREAKKTTGFLRRLYDGIVAARMRQAERAIGRHRLLLPEELVIAGPKISYKNEDSLPFVR